MWLLSILVILRMQTLSEYLDQYRIIKPLGTGYHADVFLAQGTDKTLVAIKKFKSSTATLSTLHHQLSIMKKINHQNLVNLIDVREDALFKRRDGSSQKCFGIILEYVGGGELFDFIAIGGKFSETETRTYFYQLMNAIHYLHEKGYAHRDIKPENILLASNYQLKLADFGFATLLEGRDKSYVLHTKLGTEGYMAPEILTKNYQGRSVDIFSCGVILFIMLTACPPFQKSVPNDYYYRLIKNKQYATFWSYHSKKRPPGFFSDSFKDLVQRMIAYDPAERPSVVEISQHPWTKGKVLSIQGLKQQFDKRKACIEAQNQKQRLLKEKEKEEIKTSIFKPNQAYRNCATDDFKEQYEIEAGIDRALKPNVNVGRGDFVVNESLDFFITSLKLYLKRPVENFNPSFEMDGSKIEVKYEHDDEDGAIVRLEINLSEDGKKNIVMSFNLVEGSPIYYKRLVYLIQREFSYCGRKI